MGSISGRIGCTAETLRKWVRQAEPDQGKRAGLSSQQHNRLKALERESCRLKFAIGILRKAAVFFRLGGATGHRAARTEVMLAFINAHRGEYRVEAIGAWPQIAPSVYDEQLARRADPTKCPP